MDVLGGEEVRRVHVSGGDQSLELFDERGQSQQS